MSYLNRNDAAGFAVKTVSIRPHPWLIVCIGKIFPKEEINEMIRQKINTENLLIIPPVPVYKYVEKEWIKPIGNKVGLTEEEVEESVNEDILEKVRKWLRDQPLNTKAAIVFNSCDCHSSDVFDIIVKSIRYPFIPICSNPTAVFDQTAEFGICDDYCFHCRKKPSEHVHSCIPKLIKLLLEQ